MKKHAVRKIFVSVLVASMLLSSGCLSSKSSVPPPASEDSAALPPVSGFVDDIQDIVVPTTLEWNRKESMTIKTESFRGGIWHYKGSAEVMSLKDFMVSAMQDNKWKLVGETTSKEIMLAFVKPNKTCMMVIKDSKLGKTALSLYVTIDKTAATSLNPFGEAVTQ